MFFLKRHLYDRIQLHCSKYVLQYIKEKNWLHFSISIRWLGILPEVGLGILKGVTLYVYLISTTSFSLSNIQPNEYNFVQKKELNDESALKIIP